jgi:hypothetical protein
MSEQDLVENMKIYYLIFPWVVGLKTYNVLYKTYLNESFGEYLSHVNNYVKGYCVPYSKLVWNRGINLSEDGSTASNLWSVSISRVFDPS